MRVKLYHCDIEIDIDVKTINMVIGWFIMFGDPKYREVALVEKLVDIKRSLENANSKYVEAALLYENELAEKALNEMEEKHGLSEIGDEPPPITGVEPGPGIGGDKELEDGPKNSVQPGSEGIRNPEDAG